jgi:two-component system chemotaxis sensor kinase CheA
MSDLDPVIKEFLVESSENLDQLDRDLVSLEEDPHNCERLASIFRTIHTIKGTCGFFGFAKLGALTHAGENLLSRLRDGELLLDAEITSALLALVDAVRELLAGIDQTGQEGPGDYATLIATLTRLQGRPPANPQAAPRPAEVHAGPQPVPNDPPLIPSPLADNASAASGEETAAPITSPPEDEVELPAAAPEARPAGLSEGTIRVDVGLLDKLMNLVGELVLARNQILQFTTNQTGAGFLSTSQRLNLITTELQEGIMKTRMQPIGNIWKKFPRVVRDLALTCGKQVRIAMEGKETELDKTIIEAIRDPLTHLVRNAVDHGIEAPETRLARGKPAEGQVLLRAFHEGGKVNIEIADDGAGIDTERVRHKALKRGLITHEQAARMTERELLHLIFLPGFSTAEKVTSVSGRGVGMDVVKTNIEKIGGTLDLQSRPGQGTTVKIKIPLTLAIIPALIVTCGGDRYAIPQVSLLELVRLEGKQARQGIERIHGVPVYRLRGKLLPLVYLHRELKVESRQANSDQEAVNLVVLQADDRQFGLVVDGINDTEEIVVKPLAKQLKDLLVFAGATIMGDGRVALILDVLGIARSAGVVSEVRERTLGDKPAHAPERRDAKHTVLLLGLGKERRLALPLSQVARLEEIPSSAVEWSADQETVQYRGQILPLVRLGRMLQDGLADAPAQPGAMQVVVYSEQERSVGLVVDRILDIVETALDMQPSARRTGVAGSAIIQQRVTDLLDMPSLLRAAHAASVEDELALAGRA